MLTSASSIRPFIGAKDYDVSRRFYAAVGFEERVLFPDMSVFILGPTAFYLQRYYKAEWVDNTMVFLEVENVAACHAQLAALDLPGQFPGARLNDIRHEDWGDAFALIDPSGILWHVGAFKKEQ
ncbi:glyoxalase [Flaviaesturariibacter aridisoli]|uniref:Glyoxalase n=1 Tax=Flaviaesturariibacter aridisoli TaxID=2545761 RepID=A0A4R4DT46_9BACT|nr:glyoxalase [Flaviaesturariibacter aridisoli]TCZ65876.1 glyoxalase [Flaviaesturariibacter aridisoli]